MLPVEIARDKIVQNQNVPRVGLMGLALSGMDIRFERSEATSGLVDISFFPMREQTGG